MKTRDVFRQSSNVVAIVILAMFFIFVFLPKASLSKSGVVVLANGACDLEPYYEEDAFDEPMRFFHATSKGNNSLSQWIAAVGVITVDTPDKFREFVESEKFLPSMLFFHSPGGNLGAGVELGREIRAREMSTHVGRTVRWDMEQDHPCRSWVDFVLDGTCTSSCAYAFLGGVARSVDTPYFSTAGSLLGFHQFWIDQEGSNALTRAEANELASAAVSTAQVISGVVVEYVVDMGVDPRIVTLANTAGPDDLFFPTSGDLDDLQIITQEGLEKWFIEPVDAGLVASVRSGNKTSLFRQATAFCNAADDSRASLLIATEIEPQYSDLDVLPLRALEITIDGVKASIPRQELSLQISDGKLHITARLPQFARVGLLNARHILFNLAAANAMGNFFVEGDLSEEDRKKLSLAWRYCL